MHGDGRQSRCFTYVSDTVRGTFLAGFTPEAEGKVINLGNPHETTILELAEMIRDAVGSQSVIEHAPPTRTTTAPGSRTPAGGCPTSPGPPRSCDWRPEVSLDDGLARTIEWWEKTHR